MSLTILERLEALGGDEALMLTGVDVKDGWNVVASVSVTAEGFCIQATWSGEHHAGIEPFALARTFTEARYAAEWLEGHLVEVAEEVQA